MEYPLRVLQLLVILHQYMSISHTQMYYCPLLEYNSGHPPPHKQVRVEKLHTLRSDMIAEKTRTCEDFTKFYVHDIHWWLAITPHGTRGRRRRGPDHTLLLSI